MLETNIRVVRPGSDLFIWTRTATVSGPSLTPELVQKACGAIRHRHGLAAVASPTPATLIIASKDPIQPIHLSDDQWQLDVVDSGDPADRLYLTSPKGTDLVPEIIERALLARIASMSDLWTIDSPRIWYEANPFCVKDGVAAYRRYEIGTVAIENVGVGLAADVGVGFFSLETLAHFCASDIDPEEQRRRLSIFSEYTRRQDGQKGTLLYDYGRGRSKCYFESAPKGITCATTGAVVIKRQSYGSLLEYYQKTNSNLRVSASTPAVRVSFPGLEYPQFVPADRLRVRIMNEDVPDSIRDIDKFHPAERRSTLDEFWRRLGPRPLGSVAPGVEDLFWRPGQEHIVQFAMPSITFGEGEVLAAPTTPSPQSYKDNFRQRLQKLKQTGCYQVSTNITRKFYCAYPKHLGKEQAERFASNLAQLVSQLIRKPMTAELVGYDSVNEAIEQLRDADQSGMVLFVLNDEPSAYYEAEFQLSGWRIKRVTERTLEEHHRYLNEGSWDKRAGQKTLEAGKAKWNGYLYLIALDVIQLLDVIPFRIDQAGPYEAQLIIDVGHDRRHFAVSLLIARPPNKTPSFRIVSRTQLKMDNQQEGINPKLLSNEIVELFDLFRGQFDAIESLLILRDGRIVKREPEGLNDAIGILQTKEYLTSTCRVDWVDVHKDTLKNIRFWDITESGSVVNPLLGTGILLNQSMISVATTGQPSLTQGTADPLLVVSNGRCSNIVDAAKANFSGAQLNWSSPGVAQKLHLCMKRTDDDLQSRAAQEIRRLR